jgi:hypothetical protein
MRFWQMEFSNITTVLELHSFVRRLVCTCGHYRFVVMAFPASVVGLREFRAPRYLDLDNSIYNFILFLCHLSALHGAERHQACDY